MGKRLLVVDSDRRFIQDHKSPLESAFEVDFLYATEGALTRLESGQYGAILLCVETSENKGYALCSAIRRTPQHGDLKIALISAKASEEEYARHRGTKGKADLYLHKPITANALVPALAAFVPMREDDPDNPLGDLAGTDLGDEWLESLKSELEADGSVHVPAPPPAPILPIVAPQVIAPAPGWATEGPARNQGEIELLEWRVKDLELKLAAQFAELERKNREIEELIQRNAAVTRNLDEVQQTQSEAELLRRKVQEQDAKVGQLQDELQEALNEQTRMVDQLEEVNVLLTEKTEKNTELMESHQLLQAQLEEAWEVGDRVRVLEGSLSESQEAMRTQEARAGVSEQTVRDLQEEMRGARSELAEKLARINELENALGRLKDMEGELTSAREQVSFQDLTIRNLAEERAALQKDRERQDDALTEQAGEMIVLQERIALLESGSRDVVAERDGLLETRRHLEASVADLEGRLEACEEALETQRKELLAGFEERDAQLGRLNTSLESQLERLSHMEEEKQQLESQIQGRNDRLLTITTVLTELEGKAHQALDLAKAVNR